jgi:hypothetical protein
LQLFSHKLLRRLVVFPLLVLFITSLFLWSEGIFYQLVIAGELMLYGLAGAGLALEGSKLGRFKLFSLPYYFCLVNGACLLAAWNVLRGRRIIRWNTSRADMEETAVMGQPTTAPERSLS